MMEPTFCGNGELQFKATTLLAVAWVIPAILIGMLSSRHTVGVTYSVDALDAAGYYVVIAFWVLAAINAYFQPFLFLSGIGLFFRNRRTASLILFISGIACLLLFTPMGFNQVGIGLWFGLLEKLGVHFS